MAIALRGRIAVAMLLAAPAAPLLAPQAHAVSAAQACYQKFNAERKAGTVKGQTYKEFKAAQCATPEAAAAAPATPATPAAPATAATPAAPAAPVAAAAPAAAAAGSAVLPNAVSAQYASESAGKARLHTCLDQYKANKATNANGGLKWIQKGGGYYSVCNAHLKG
ncbi:hypothetical protein GLI01_35160 [Gluconacetobacter liquefaciens]|uniref:Uncharacterized protein n=1 Tax=Gluconacetobacter liquefaciens TaxID=89584 RepID=A0A370G240_GLULI|nr:hypothetical protein [Gluconacetobacter liquefaciens]MBB2187061.1 hypothetical protein [Gluconacetobacter liquefaciens]RDI37036.1 hypothetical protein C7453_10782 [Gluconacetobacter liquefaciens]GEB39481.1 hypothetical protein GLI01_35160 [Gluconacetobacter liquefaciens]